jgi:hypothetical protein
MTKTVMKRLKTEENKAKTVRTPTSAMAAMVAKNNETFERTPFLIATDSTDVEKNTACQKAWDKFEARNVVHLPQRPPRSPQSTPSTGSSNSSSDSSAKHVDVHDELSRDYDSLYSGDYDIPNYIPVVTDAGLAIEASQEPLENALSDTIDFRFAINDASEAPLALGETNANPLRGLQP